MNATTLNRLLALLLLAASLSAASALECGSSQVLGRTDYDAFGVLIDRTGTTDNSFLYCGERWDANLGFYYLRARYMNPGTGRFWTMDSYEGDPQSPASLHKYTYCSGNPVNSHDPSGMLVGPAPSLDLTAANAIGAGIQVSRISPAVPFLSGARSFMHLYAAMGVVCGTGIGAGVYVSLYAAAMAADAVAAFTAAHQAQGIAVQAAMVDKVLTVTAVDILDSKYQGWDWVIVYRYADATNPGAFARQGDGMSTFTRPDPTRKYNIPFVVLYKKPLVPETSGIVAAPPGPQAVYTPKFGEGHWSLNAPVPEKLWRDMISQYAKALFVKQ